MNRAHLTLMKEQKLNKDFSAAEKSAVALYICCDGITAWLSYVDNIEQVRELIDPKNIIELLEGVLSQDEYDIFEPLMKSGSTYRFYDEIYKVE